MMDKILRNIGGNGLEILIQVSHGAWKAGKVPMPTAYATTYLHKKMVEKFSLIRNQVNDREQLENRNVEKLFNESNNELIYEKCAINEEQ